MEANETFRCRDDIGAVRRERLPAEIADEPQGPGVRRRSKLSAPVPVRFPEDVLQQLRDRAADDDRSVSQWIRRAVERELARANG